MDIETEHLDLYIHVLSACNIKHSTALRIVPPACLGSRKVRRPTELSEVDSIVHIHHARSSACLTESTAALGTQRLYTSVSNLLPLPIAT